eukprot:TRINITY_DN1025_c0_g1_i4.p1 TRINITY_DN1025_c0_g1~~TRINITY_DN1025_c0_g1_i4.p1  ORF type:complete len:345 (-),score=69.01 TRINITY_DN1025_c0_g1_i4:35-1069(-)
MHTILMKELQDSHVIQKMVQKRKRKKRKKRNSKRKVLYNDEETETIFYNLRDIALVSTKLGSPVTPKLIYRSASVSRGKTNVDQVKNVIYCLTEILKVKTIIDLRTKPERKADQMDYLVEQAYPTVPWKRKGSLKNLSRNATSASINLPERRRYSVPLVNAAVKKALIIQLQHKRNTTLKMVRALVTKNIQATKSVFVDHAMNPIGLAGLNRLMLKHCHDELSFILKLAMDESRLPLLYHCASGKDRTGLVTMLLLKSIDVPEKAIVKDYIISQEHLGDVAEQIVEENRKVGLDAGFDGTPKEVMEDTLGFLQDRYNPVGKSFFEKKLKISPKEVSRFKKKMLL